MLDKTEEVTMKKDSRIALRLQREQRLKMQELLKKRKFKTLSEVIRSALDEFLSKELSSNCDGSTDKLTLHSELTVSEEKTHERA